MKYYELLSLVSGNLTETEVKAVEERISGLIKANQGEIVRSENAGKIKLAYPVGDLRYGFYLLTVFQAETNQINVIKRALKLSDDVVRAEIVETTGVAPRRPIQIVAYQEPVVDHDRDREESRYRATRPAPVVSAPVVVAAKPLSSEELEHQIDKILEEKVL